MSNENKVMTAEEFWGTDNNLYFSMNKFQFAESYATYRESELKEQLQNEARDSGVYQRELEKAEARINALESLLQRWLTRVVDVDQDGVPNMPINESLQLFEDTKQALNK